MKNQPTAIISGFIIILTACAALSKGSSIADYYVKLTEGDKIDAVLDFKNNRWQFVQSRGGEKVTGKGAPIIDRAHGYMSYSYSEPPCFVETELALFIDAAKNDFVAVSRNQACIEGTVYAFIVYSVSPGKLTDVSDGIMTLPPEEFFDEKRVSSDDGLRSGLDELKTYMVIRYKLPRVGTTVTAVLSAMDLGHVGVDQDKIAEVGEFLRKNKKYLKIELGWNMQKGKFQIHRKIK